ncbi:MAG: HAD-IC family P-type ATPase, partial [Armatimonadetes bacterium]|nr:HAD-IC family P-type ATPase [Armatimonadota bacterium]
AFAARRGILVRGGNFIEIAGRADAFAIDKTGTLTEGKPKLAEVRCCGSCSWKAGEEMSSEVREIIATAAAVETFSTHPIAQAIVNAAALNKIDFVLAEDIVTEPGLGMLAQVGKTAVKLGQRKFFADSLPDGFDAEVEALQSQGMTTVVLQAGTTTAVLGMMDLPRPNAAGFVSSLRAAGIKRIVMLTGDHLRTAEAIGKLVGVDEIHAGVMPAEKEEFVRKMSTENTVVMLGDGVNDAPALARAHLGIAMGGLGSEVAMQAADVVLVQDRIERIPELLRLGGRTNRTIKANLIFGSLMIVSLAAFSFLWPVLWGKDMPLPLAVIGHEGSTVLVILNGLRLLRSE